MSLAKCRECGAEVSTSAKVCPKCGVSKPVKRTSIFVKVLAGLFGLAVLGSVMNGGSGKSSPSHSGGETEASKPTRNLSPKEEALAAVKLGKWGWEKGGFDNVMFINATVKNEGARDVKDIEITCIHASKSGTEIDRNSKVIYELIKAGKSINIKKFNMGFIHTQAASSSCEITDLVLMN